jgi:hypothetical protein
MRARGPKDRTEWKNEVDRGIKKSTVRKQYEPLPGQISLFDVKESHERDPTEDEIEGD